MSTSTIENKALLQRLYDEVFNANRNEKIEELIAAEAITHETFPGADNNGREVVRQLNAMFHTAFPDFKVTTNDMIAVDDKVVARITMSGSHQGELMGVPPTGKAVAYQSIDIVRCANGQMVEHWAVTDTMALMQQLGVIPELGPEV